MVKPREIVHEQLYLKQGAERVKDHLNLQCIKYLCALCPVKNQHARKVNRRSTTWVLTGISFTDITVEAKVEIKFPI